MDPIGAIKVSKDSTLAMLREASRRGYELFYMETGDLYLAAETAMGNARPLRVFEDDAHWFELGEKQAMGLGELDVVLMRKDPPFDTEYIYSTYILEAAARAGALLVNNPVSIRNANEKLFATHFPGCIAPSTVSSDAGILRAFLAEHGDVIFKPLGEMGGASVFRVRENDPNISVIIETLTDYGRRYIMAQRFIPEIDQGDKRILLIDGEAVPYALARIPARGETRGNLAAGGRGEGIALTARDREICAAVGPVLKDMGLIFVGIDVIGDYLTEINSTSPTCIRELDALYNLNISAQLMDVIESKLA
jgi:glutathione synthase